MSLCFARVCLATVGHTPAAAVMAALHTPFNSHTSSDFMIPFHERSLRPTFSFSPTVSTFFVQKPDINPS